jgi:hypothetical protein
MLIETMARAGLPAAYVMLGMTGLRMKSTRLPGATPALLCRSVAAALICATTSSVRLRTSSSDVPVA